MTHRFAVPPPDPRPQSRGFFKPEVRRRKLDTPSMSGLFKILMLQDDLRALHVRS